MQIRGKEVKLSLIKNTLLPIWKPERIYGKTSTNKNYFTKYKTGIEFNRIHRYK